MPGMDGYVEPQRMLELIKGVSRFREHVFPEQKERYRRLASHGQAPKALVIACSDSRVMPEIITQSGPGDIFVCRNAGNIVPPYDGSAEGMSASIEFAVVGLGVRDIIVLGHTDCGAMKGVLHPDKLANMPNVGRWLEPCRCAQGDLLTALAHDGDDATAVRRLAMANLATQLENLRHHPSVDAGLAHGDLRLHAWLFDIARGEVLARRESDGTFRPLNAGENEGVDVPLQQPQAGRQHLLLEI